MLKLVILSVATLAASLIAAEAAYFVIQAHEETNEFIFELTDDAKIAHARQMLEGEEAEPFQLHGNIVKSTASYNPDWSFHIDPNTVEFLAQGTRGYESSLDMLQMVLSKKSDQIPDYADICPLAPFIRESWLEAQ